MALNLTCTLASPDSSVHIEAWSHPRDCDLLSGCSLDQGIWKLPRCFYCATIVEHQCSVPGVLWLHMELPGELHKLLILSCWFHWTVVWPDSGWFFFLKFPNWFNMKTSSESLLYLLYFLSNGKSIWLLWVNSLLQFTFSHQMIQFNNESEGNLVSLSFIPCKCRFKLFSKAAILTF